MKLLSLLLFLVLTIDTIQAQNDLPGNLKDKVKPCDNTIPDPLTPSPGDSVERYSAKIWPNPSIESFNLKVQSPSHQDIKIIISDLMGKKVEEFFMDNNASVIFGKMFSPGLYVIRIKQGSEIMSTFKLIKQ
ncbi:MAG TPA: T9SS type A sorting domain-containing protein [Lentimicrobium sp.]|nr:T9SS type A sorting domain-containing protein [Lentimicrobium sp.]